MTIWRSIPHISYNIPDNEECGSKSGFQLILILLNLALIETFQEQKYKKFAILYSAFYEDSTCTIEIITPEVDFISHFEKMISGVHNMDHIESLVMGNMGQFSTTIHQIQMGENIAASIVYDRQAGRITLGEEPLQMDVSTTSGLLFHIAEMLRSEFIFDDTGAMYKYPNYKKFVIYNMDYGKIEFPRIKINADNYEEWDYLFPEYDREVEENKAFVDDIIEPHKLLESNQPNRMYDVALSFAGEDRHIVKEIAEALDEHSISVFYDKYEKAKMWGKRLDNYFKSTYAKNTRYVIPFISEHYPKKDWTNFEFSIANAEAKKRDIEFILPIRIDDTPIVGIPDSVGYLDYNDEGTEGIVKTILYKLEF